MKKNQNEAPKKNGIMENKGVKDMLLDQVTGGGKITIPLVHEFVNGKCKSCQLEYDVYIASGRSIPCR